MNTDQQKGKHTSQCSPNEEPNLIPTSNYYAVLSTLPDQITQDSTLEFDRDPMQTKNLQQNKKCKSQLKSCPLVYKKIISPSTTDEWPQQRLTHHCQNMSTIPMIVNGVITKTRVFGSGPPSSLINPAHKVILSGDSHIKGLAIELRAILTSDYELFSVVKPGSGTNVLHKSITETVEHLTNDDILVISSGTNDYNCVNCSNS